MLREFCLSLGLVVIFTACVPAPNAPRVKPFEPPPALRQAALPQHEFRGYRLAGSFVEKSSFRDGAPLRTGAIVGGLRVRTDASGLSLADTVTEPALLGGTQVPEPLGGGLLFWSASALYTADTFLGLLRPLASLGYKPVGASFGPTFVLLRGSEGQRMAIDVRARQRAALSPPLLVDIASSNEGRALALLEGGQCALSADAGKTYAPVVLPPFEHATGVQSVGDVLVARLSSGSQLRLEKGRPPLVAAAPSAPSTRPRSDALWPLGEPPIERALRFGVPIGDEFAGVAVGGAVATVNLRTGELVQMTRALVPSDVECRALDAKPTLLLVCNARDRGSIVLSDVFGERPLTEAKFPAGVRLAFADGVLLAESRCTGEASPGAVCVRGADGRFRDLDVSAKLAARGPGALVSRFIPKIGGGALAVVTGPSAGFLDVQSGAFVPLAPEAPRAVLDAARGKDSWLALDWVALADGAIRGWLPRSSVGIALNGRAEPNVYEFQSVVAAGAHAIAFDKGRHAFQSSDWGHTWLETLAPPGSASGSVSMSGARCSPVGCHLGPWLRVGWELEVPGALSRAQVAPPPPGLTRAPLPALSCRERAAAVVLEEPATEAALDPAKQRYGFGKSARPLLGTMNRGFFSWSTVRPQGGAGPAVGLRAGLVLLAPPPSSDSGPPPRSWGGYAQSKTFSFVAAFEPSARVRSASVTWRALFDAAAEAGGPAPSLEGDDDAALSALPVLARDPGRTDGLWLDDGAPVWVHDIGPAQAVSLGTGTDAQTVISAVASAPHTLALLIAGDDGSLEVREIAGGQTRRLFQIPNLDASLVSENADALAIGPRGAFAVLRTRSGSEPATRETPPVLLDEHGTATALAPWSRLFLADTPECKAQPSDYRVILQTTSAWLSLIDGNVPVSQEASGAGMFAMLRLNADRICLEAVELAQDPVRRGELELPTRLVARFVGPSTGAARVGFAPGFELRQPLECALSAPR